MVEEFYFSMRCREENFLKNSLMVFVLSSVLVAIGILWIGIGLPSFIQLRALYFGSLLEN